jgi:adenylosuccinate synthase
MVVAHVVDFTFEQADGLHESNLAANKLGTTGKGIGPAYSSKAVRNGKNNAVRGINSHFLMWYGVLTGIRLGDLQNMEYFESRLRVLAKHMTTSFPELQINIEEEMAYYKEVRDEILSMTVDTVEFVHRAHAGGKRILIEGANATMLDLDFGTYPFVTSSNPSIGSVCTGLGIPPSKLGSVTGIVKAYCTR